MCGQQIHMLFDHCFRFAIPIQVLSRWFFYQAPVELETIEDGTLLQFLSMWYNQPQGTKYLKYGKFVISISMEACVSVRPG